MGWNGSLTADSAVGSAITFTPETSTWHAYTVGAFTAPRKGVYRFLLRGSGGAYRSTDGSSSAGGTGGTTTGYLIMESGETVYVGAGGPCSAAFVSGATGAALKNIARDKLYFVAGGGGGGGARWGFDDNKSGPGGNGGGTSGAGAPSGGAGGSQTGGYAYGEGQPGEYGNDGASYHRGDGGDGLYGGYQGAFTSGTCWGGGGGSGYIHTGSVKAGSKTYTNATQQGGGAGSNTRGSVEVSYYARAELPVIFNGTALERLIFNGVEIESLVYDGVKLFMRSMMKRMRRWRACLS